MKSNNYIKLSNNNCYAHLPDGTPCGLIFDDYHKPIGLFIATCGKTKWLTLEMIEQKRRENFDENCRWENMPVIVQDDPWQIVCFALAKEHAAYVKELINTVENIFKTNISEEE